MLPKRTHVAEVAAEEAQEVAEDGKLATKAEGNTEEGARRFENAAEAARDSGEIAEAVGVKEDRGKNERSVGDTDPRRQKR